MYKQTFTKPDGRSLTLYGDKPITVNGPILSPRNEPVAANPHLRWHPLREEWITYAGHRQHRTFLPPPEYNPLLPSADRNAATELPTGEYDIAVFDNLFPSLAMTAHDPPSMHIPTLPALGKCEVVVFAQNPTTSLALLPMSHIALLLETWGDRTCELSRDATIKYVLPFENRGVEVGVTLHHPHGQLYAYPVVPPIPQRLHEAQSEYFSEHARPLLQDLIAQEVNDPVRVLYLSEHAIAFVPAWARYPYEVWVGPRIAVPYLHELSEVQRLECARALKTVLQKFDGLWKRPFPYIMAWYQAPTDGQAHPEWHVHAELYPPYRAADKLKYLAGTEIAAGMFASDVLPEAAALELRRVQIESDRQ
jgi:UDPglucose--hexose-1-phosphate uridylyltransferase